MSTFGALANSLPLYTSAAPQIKYALVKGVLKGEDVTLVQPVIPWPKEASSAPEPTAIPSERPDTDGRLSGEHSSSQGAFGAFCVFDGHNGPQAAQSCKRDFLRLLLGQLPPGPMPQDPELPEFAGWRESIQKALAVTFHQMQHSFASSGVLAGTTATCVLQTGCLVTVANVGDSLGLLDTGYDVLAITADHRVCDSAEEQDRVTQLGGTITNVDRSGHGPSADPVNGLGPLRIWPGGVANARAIGDFDVPGYLLPCPHIHQLVVPRQGGRMVIASDGVWDAFDMKRVAKLTRSHPTAVAAGKILTTVVRAQGGLRDDTSLIVVDILPPGVDSFPEAIGRKKPSSGGTSSGQKELAAARTAVQSSSWCCMSRPAVIEADASVYNASVHSDPSVHPDISLRSRPLARMLADVDVAAVLGLMPGVRRPFSGLWRDAVLLAALVETQKDALEVFNNSFGQRRQGLKPAHSTHSVASLPYVDDSAHGANEMGKLDGCNTSSCTEGV
ncbi:hypothetical protein WJX72_012226 [[Myrmecia] bisecta]|uniref:PPM-type phosphatase domain-containing protein n=1 Tax=[Myrmecia] bisecta TaxID=41462 RepID=A0AAW1P3P0_9CHLO